MYEVGGTDSGISKAHYNAPFQRTENVMEGGFAFYDIKMLKQACKHIPVIPVNQQRWCKRIQNSSVVYITRPWLFVCFVSEISSRSDLRRD